MNKTIQSIILVGYIIWAVMFALWTVCMAKKDWEKGTLYSLLMVFINSICLILYFIGKAI